MKLTSFRRYTASLALGLGLATASLSGAMAEKHLRIGNDGEPESMDPHMVSTVQTSRIIEEMLVGLTTADAAGNAIAGAAKNWTISDDGLVYTFKIRPHNWTDGVPVTAHDFEYAFKRILNPETAAKYASLLYVVEGAEGYNTGKTGPEPVQAKALDDMTFQVKLNAPAPYFLQQLTHQTAFPVPKHVVEKHGRDWIKPDNIVGNGAYKFVEWVPNVHVILEKNPDFYDAENVKIDKVTYFAHEDRTTMQKRFRAGELDVARDFASEQIKFIVENMPDEVRIAPYAGTYYYVFNTTKPPFDDVRVRQALSMAINREVITHKVLATGELPAYSFVPPGTGNYDEPSYAPFKGQNYDQALEKAKALLAEAGYGPDKPLEFVLRYNTSENHKRIAIAITAMWKKLGVKAELFNSEGKIHYADLQQGDFQAARAGWIADYNDPQNFLFLLDDRTGPMNYGNYDNTMFNDLMKQAEVTSDLTKRSELLAKAEKVAMEEQPVAPIYYYVSKQLVSKGLQNWIDNPFDKHNARWLDLK